MEAGIYVDALEREAGRLVAAASGGLGRPIAACPGWVVADVLGHLGRVYRSVTDIVSNRLVDQPTTRVPKPPSGDEVVEFLTTGLADLVEVLRSTPPDVPVELVNLRVAAAAPPRTEFVPEDLPQGAPPAAKAHRQVYFKEARGYVHTPVYERSTLRTGFAAPGPLVIEDASSSLVVGPKGHVEQLASGNLVITIEDGET